MPIKDKRFVFTGELSKDREYFTNLVLMSGGKVTHQVSGLTNYLVVGEDGGKVKMRKAEEIGCKIIGENEFMRMVNDEGDLTDKEKGMGSVAERGDVAGRKKGMGSGAVGKNLRSKTKNTNDIERTEDRIGKKGEKMNVKNKLARTGELPTKNDERTQGVKTPSLADGKPHYGMLWTVKYEPRILDEVLGNKTAKDHVLNFLEHYRKGKALLISGPPGVGKSLSVKLACKSTNYEMTEFNASDVRNKSSLTERVRQFVNCGCISGRRRVLVMDECDGMTGDRGGIAELVQIIRDARMPVICICNDKYAVRPLVNVCEEVTFRKLETRQILGRVRDIVREEGKDVKDKEIVEVCGMANNDMRYILNCLQGSVMYKKVVSRNLFDEVLALFGRGRVGEKMETFFSDYEMMPLMVYENYLRSDMRDREPGNKAGKAELENAPDNGLEDNECNNAHKHNKRPKNHRINVYELDDNVIRTKMCTYAHASDSISLADTYLRKMGSNDWSLLNHYALFGALIPAQNLKINKRIEFPKVLGNTSKSNKHHRVIQTFHFHILSKCDPTEFYFYDMPLLIKAYIANLNEGRIEESVQFLVDNKLLKSDCDDGMGVYGWEKSVSTKGKSAITRAYKKVRRCLPYNDEE
ncbi:hypothetical protein VCUG_02198 [Vavraia culicis subsp. floridensis]|uniref:BRCT domain-containing protein n=1 Tax=Vavraia culicis (isolate floridensis) TaxID=948595 RepID=L2GT79_VAVCU|nr:uncharacterized protein VCUG_02198 [Vavraia culicis subsp. floridensis]ELA46310.1 hypothetical protein VCUG_02198 [Vavraia culicis subsp. floridensis]